jgi:hypothetical protein
LVKQVEAIKFSVDWRQKGTRAGGRTYKQDFVQKAFDHDPKHNGLHANGSSEDKKIYHKAFRVFKIKHGKTIMVRNYLLQLFEQVFEQL